MGDWVEDDLAEFEAAEYEANSGREDMEIATLRAENARLREALQTLEAIATKSMNATKSNVEALHKARALLAGKEGEG